MDTPLDIEGLRIREERAADLSDISRITTNAFAPMPFSGGTEAQIIEALRVAGALAVSLVATSGDELVGHVAFSPVRIDDRSGTWYALGPVSVAPQTQSRGIGGALILHGLDVLRKRQAGGCVLLGAPAYYGRFGFVSDPTLTYQGRPNRFFQRLFLNDSEIAGDVAYHPAFDVS